VSGGLAERLIAAERRVAGRFALCIGSGSRVERLCAELPASSRDVFWADGDVRAAPPGRIHRFDDADVYEGLLRAYFGARPQFDAVVLEPGTDGTVAGIRPGSAEALEDERWAISTGEAGLTLTLPALREAAWVVLLGGASPLLPGAEVVGK
jgi:hypothetical protein